jgi:hypothetical protein
VGTVASATSFQRFQEVSVTASDPTPAPVQDVDWFRRFPNGGTVLRRLGDATRRRHARVSNRTVRLTVGRVFLVAGATDYGYFFGRNCPVVDSVLGDA